MEHGTAHLNGEDLVAEELRLLVLLEVLVVPLTAI